MDSHSLKYLRIIAVTCRLNKIINNKDQVALLSSEMQKLCPLFHGVQHDVDHQADPQEYDQMLVVSSVGFAPQLHLEPLREAQLVDPVSPLEGIADRVVEEHDVARVRHGEDEVAEEEEVEAEARLLPLEVQEAERERVQQHLLQSPQVVQLDVDQRAGRVLLDQFHEHICN